MPADETPRIHSAEEKRAVEAILSFLWSTSTRGDPVRVWAEIAS